MPASRQEVARVQCTEPPGVAWGPRPGETQPCTPRPNCSEGQNRQDGGRGRERGHTARACSRQAGVLTPARDFWMFSLALAMSRRITLAPFSCRQCRKNQSFSFFFFFIKKFSTSKTKQNKKRSPCVESERVVHRTRARQAARSARCQKRAAAGQQGRGAAVAGGHRSQQGHPA